MMKKRRKILPVLFASMILLQGCAYRMPGARGPSQLKLRVDIDTPTGYVVTVENAKGAPPSFPAFSPLARALPEGSPASDGKIVVEVPPARGTCSVYLLNRIKVRGSKFTSYVVVLKSGSRTVRRIAVTDVQKLPMDSQGYHILSVR